jgi:hypothetical protein
LFGGSTSSSTGTKKNVPGVREEEEGLTCVDQLTQDALSHVIIICCSHCSSTNTHYLMVEMLTVPNGMIRDIFFLVCLPYTWTITGGASAAATFTGLTTFARLRSMRLSIRERIHRDGRVREAID